MVSFTAVLLGLAQTVYVWLYDRGCRKASLGGGDGPWPAAAVIVCMRGLDPSLQQAVEALASQDYPDFELHLALDSSTDPAAELARRIASRAAIRTAVHVLPHPSTHCGLKCDLQRWAYSQISPAVEVVVFADADCLAEQDWLRRLVAPLADPTCGAVSGNRWYRHAPGWGSEVRRIWNAAAVVQMYLYRICWGGSLAIRRRALEECGLIDIWKSTLCEDTVVKSTLAKAGWNVVYLPTLALVSAEVCTLSSASRWIVRQLLTARLYHPLWGLVAGHSVLVGSITILLIGGILASAIAGQWLSLAVFFAGLVVYQSTNLALLAWIERLTVPESLRLEEGTKTRRRGTSQFGLVTLTQVIHSLAAIRALVCREITWRGIRYRVAKRRVEMLEYHPCQPSLSDSKHSIF